MHNQFITKSLCILFFLTSAIYLKPIDRYVAKNGQNPIPPYTNWNTAASNIQEVVDVCSMDDTIWVDSGIYYANPVATNIGNITNVIFISKKINLISINGPSNTIIDGANLNRVIYCRNFTNLYISGFTIRNGMATHYGGGMHIYSTIASTITVANCIIESNMAKWSNSTIIYGGGIYAEGSFGGTNSMFVISNCYIKDNIVSNNGNEIRYAYGGGACFYLFGAKIYNSTIENNIAGEAGGGLLFRTGAHLNNIVENCIIKANKAVYGTIGGRGGGGIAISPSGASYKESSLIIRNSLFYDNYAYLSGGAILNSSVNITNILENCTIVKNYATSSGGGIFGVTNSSWLIANSIIISNTSPGVSSNFSIYNTTILYSCIPSTNGIFHGTTNSYATNNIYDNPMFVNYSSDDFRLNKDSLCIDSGTILDWHINATDLDGKRRLGITGKVDIGCYEFSHPGTIFTFE